MARWAPRLLRIAAVLAVVAVGMGLVGDDPPSPTGSARPTGSSVPGAATTTPRQPEGPWAELPVGAAPGVLLTPDSIMVPIVADLGDGTFEVQTPCDGRAVVGGFPLAGAHVVLDPGHGGEEPGAVGPNGLAEKDLNLAVAQRAAEILRAAGATVVLTRETDLRVTLATRAGIAVGLQPVAFVSIHHNAAPDGPSLGPGTEAYFQVQSPESRRLAGLVVEEVRAALAPFAVAWESDSENGAKARVRSSNQAEDFYGVLRRSAGVTAVLSEAGYLSNPAEAELFARPEVQQAEAEALARALTRFVTGDEPDAASFSPAPPTVGGAAGGGGGPDGCVDPPLG